MAAIALDLTPVVDALLERPFDRPILDAARLAVAGNPQAYATALRCAAKRTQDPLARAYWFAEAASVHESADDLGGAIALLSRAIECDPANPRTRELLAASMTRLAMRSGLHFTFGSSVEELPARSGSTLSDSEFPAPVQTGLRPPAPERSRDTLPDLFGLDVSEGEFDAPARTVPTPTLAPSRSIPSANAELEASGAAPFVLSAERARRVDPILPPAVGLRLARREVIRESPPDSELAAIADIAMPTRRSSGIVPALARRPSAPPPPDTLAQPREERDAPDTVRPVGEQLVGALFEDLHALHFLDDVREGAAFVRRIIEEKMCPGAVLVHLYDINSGHFVVVSASGPRASTLMDYPTPEDDPFVVEVMKEAEATLVIEPASDPRFLRGRWLLAEPRRSVLSAPVAIEGRYLGLIEVADPGDGSEFTEDDRNALTYVAGTFASFLDCRGIVLSEEPDAEPANAY